MDFRAPLPTEHGPDVPDAAYPLLHDALCRMHVACYSLSLGSETAFTSLCLFHRYICHHFNTANNNSANTTVSVATTEKNTKHISHHQQQEELGIIAAACIFLGTKSEEDPRRIRDIINMAHVFQFATPPTESKNENGDGSIVLGSSTRKGAKSRIVEARDLPLLDESYWALKDQVVSVEQKILRILRFDVHVSHPHRVLLAIQGMGGLDALEKSDQEDVLLCAWQVLNDSLFNPKALRLPAVSLGCAALWISMKSFRSNEVADIKDGYKSSINLKETIILRNGQIKFSPGWWLLVGIGEEELSNSISILQKNLSF
mmetsp:Transcript_27312/g.33483  ORF Transcript_27312/g.33483 Transcript_27312/m.33483 type:complete len:316 (+) Transcript_27312:30-977(+)